MLFTTKWLSNHFTNFCGEAADAITINTVTTDSRQKLKQSLFIPIVGERFDGHDYMKQALENGAVAAFWDENKPLPQFLPTDFPVFLVADTLTALQTLATHYRNNVNPIVIGITGSNGKTTTKDIVTAIAKTTYRTHYTNGNFNNHIGLPLTVLSMQKDTEVLVLEMGMSDFGEIERLSNIAKPDYAIITNIGESHIEFLGSRQGIAQAKLEITKGLKADGMVIFDGDEPLLNTALQQNHNIACGFHQKNDVIVSDVDVHTKKTTFRLSGTSYTIPLLGRHHALNAAFAIVLGEALSITKEKMKQALTTLEVTAMRFELKQGVHDVSMINDAYNASPTSMKAAIEVVKQMDGFKEKVLVLGDILELGNHSEALHRSVSEVIDSPITAVFTFGKDAEKISTAVTKEKPYIKGKHFAVKEELLAALQPYLHDEALLLFKASRGLQFESLVEALMIQSEHK
ncbi:UDP-N-acetylmuramoyl-tripeptide--D-alanyl-D-alanine ligase [Virgibacillus halotolerans]|uniref:UDP-N-acetylmuramoyl-tripeptide--D-alanyl-D- alanine ligase n=1 Tax=Virgibacillus halotolerans TaxID=1071053 RepID=UPI00195FB04F|nr:UDP-N-acetylmuramoyl-tripeptide--D-alanyl-D-alanine ligase [Virgibacillus halotolerans]